jgi:hypothetical protein
VVAVAGLAMLMLELPVAIVVVLTCWVALAMGRSARGRRGWAGREQTHDRTRKIGFD